ncbi:MAG: hypothetical protein LUD50_02840, partial [Clostridia bacterium]|nr:hypothetical protein [Clostridia bacterium]
MAATPDLEAAFQMYLDILAEMRKIMASPQEGDEKLANPSLTEELSGRVIYNRDELALVSEEVQEKLKALRYEYKVEPSGYDWFEIYGPYKYSSQWFGLAKKTILLELVMDEVMLDAEKAGHIKTSFSHTWFEHFAEYYLMTQSCGRRDEAREILLRDIYPFIGTLSIYRIKARDLKAILTRITDRGDYARAKRALEIIRGTYHMATRECPLPKDYTIITDK